MNLSLSLLLLGTAKAVTWGPQTRYAPMSMDETANIIVTPPATTDATINVNDVGSVATLPATTVATEGSIAVDGVDEVDADFADKMTEYYGNKVVDYYGNGVSVTVDKVEASSSGSVSSSSSVSVSESSSVSAGIVVKGGGSKKSKGSFWSASASKGSVTGKCLYTKESSSSKHSYSGSTSYAYTYKGSSKKSRSSQESCICTEKVSGSSAVKVSGKASKITSTKESSVKVSGSSSKVSGSASKVTSTKMSSVKESGSSAVKISGSSSKVSSGGMWAGDAHGRELQWGNDGHSNASSGGSSNKVSGGGSTSKVSGGSASKTTSGSSKVNTVKVSGSTSKMSGEKWAGDAHGASKINGSSSKVSSNKSSASKVKVSGSSSKVSSSGGVWAGDAHGASKMTSEKASKITSTKGGSVSFKSTGSAKLTDSKSSVKTVVMAAWKGDSWGPSTVTTIKTAKKSSVSIKGSASLDYSCSCDTSFEVDVCVTTPTTSKSPIPSPINPLAPEPSVPVNTNPPTAAETIEVNEIVCADDFVMTNAGVSVEIPVLDNDGTIPNGSSGSITQPNHGLTIITDSSILYVPDSNCCGLDSFTYTVTGPNGQAFCTATVSVSVICSGDSNTPPPTVTPTDEGIIVNGDNVTSAPSATPINPDGGNLNIAKPVANDDSYVTNQDESIEIAILENDTLIVGTTGTYTKPPNGALSTVDDDLLYTPNAGFCGSDMFSYTLTDATGEYSDSAVVTIEIICAPTPTPSPEADESAYPTYFTGDDLVGVPPDFTQDTVAPSPEPTMFTGDDMIGVSPEFNATQPSIERPELEDDYAITNQSVSVFIPILDNDIIPQDSTGTMGQAMHGEIEATVDGIVYSPADHFCGYEKFEYSVTDSTGMFTDAAEVTVEVLCVADPTSSPTFFTGDDFVGVPPEFEKDTLPPSPSPSWFTGDDMVGVPPNFNETQSGIDRPELYDDYATTTQGEAVIIPILTNDTIPTDSTGSFTKPKNGSVTILNGDDVLYTPNLDFCGTDSFTYTIKDSYSNEDTATVTIDVSCEEIDQPEANDDYVTTPQGVPVTIPATENDYVPVNATGQFDQPSNGVVTIGESGVVYTPTVDFCGLDMFDYIITDSTGIHSDSATVTVEVICNSTHSAAEVIAINDYVNIPQDSEPAVISVLDNDSAPDGYELYIDSLTYGANNGICSISDDNTTVIYSPNDGYIGQDSCVYNSCAADGLCDMAIVLVTVEPIASSDSSTAATTSVTSATKAGKNHRPVANDDEGTTCGIQPVFINVAANDEDKEDDALTVTSVAECKEGGTLVIIGDGTGGVVEYTPSFGFYGRDHCDYTICDEQGACDTACILVTVEKCFTVPPLAVNDASKTEAGVAIEIEVTGNDISPDGSPLTVISVGESDQGAVVAIVGNGTSGYVFYEPQAGFTGNDEFNYTITNEEGQISSAMVYVTVESEKSVEASTTVIPASGSSTGATLPSSVHSCTTTENAAVIYVVESEPAFITSATNGTNGVCEITGSATIMYTPSSGFTGTDECEYELCNGSSCITGVLTITVIADGTHSETSSTEIATTTSTIFAETTSAAESTTALAETTSTIMAETTSAPVIVHGSDIELPFASYMCPEVDVSNVTKSTLLYKYQVVLGEGADIDAAIHVIELEVNDLLASQMRCSESMSGRKLLIAGLVGADNNPADSVSDEECESDNIVGECVVINGGLTVYGDVDIEEVQNYVGSVMPEIVSSVNASVIESRLITSSATLDSSDASADEGSSNFTAVAIAGAAVVAIVGAGLLLGKHRRRQELSDESEAVLGDEFPQSSVPRDIPQGSSNDDSDTLLASTSFASKSKKSLKSVFRSSKRDGVVLPSSPAFSVSSSKSKSYDVEDTVDL